MIQTCKFTAVASLICLLALMCGCAAGRTDDGSILIGAKVAELPETFEQAAKLAAGALPEPWGTLVKGAIGLIFGGGAAAYAARRAKQREDHAWDEAEARAYNRLPWDSMLRDTLPQRRISQTDNN